MTLAPNPATMQTMVSITGLGEKGGELTALNAQGRTLWQRSSQQ
jgi:hypothetical protein